MPQVFLYFYRLSWPSMLSTPVNYLVVIFCTAIMVYYSSTVLLVPSPFQSLKGRGSEGRRTYCSESCLSLVCIASITSSNKLSYSTVNFHQICRVKFEFVSAMRIKIFMFFTSTSASHWKSMKEIPLPSGFCIFSCTYRILEESIRFYLIRYRRHEAVPAERVLYSFLFTWFWIVMKCS